MIPFQWEWPGNSCTLWNSGPVASKKPQASPGPTLNPVGLLRGGNNLTFLLYTSDATRVRVLPYPPVPRSLMPFLSFVNFFQVTELCALCTSHWPTFYIEWTSHPAPTTWRHLYLFPTYLIKSPQILTDIARYNEAFRFQIQVFSAPLDIELEIMKDPD